MTAKAVLMLTVCFGLEIGGADVAPSAAKKDQPIIELDYASDHEGGYRHFEVMASGEASFNDSTTDRCKLSTNALTAILSTLSTNGFLELHQGRMEEAVKASDQVALDRSTGPEFRLPLGLIVLHATTVSLTIRASGKEKLVTWRALEDCIRYYPTVKELQLLQSSIEVVRTNLCPAWQRRGL